MEQVFFNIGGRYADLAQKTKIQLKKSNIIFAVDKYECERTLTMTLPDTHRNRLIFGEPAPAYGGDRVRGKYAAQIQVGGVTLTGAAYVDSYSRAGWSVIFVCGDFDFLTRINGVGSIASAWSGDSPMPIAWYDTEGVAASIIDASDRWDIVNYRAGVETNALLPAVSVGGLLSDIVERTGINVDLPEDVWRYWSVLHSLRGAREKEIFLESESLSFAAIANNINAGSGLLLGSTSRVVRGIKMSMLMAGGVVGNVTDSVHCYQALQDLRITFGDDFPEGVFGVVIPSVAGDYTNELPDIDDNMAWLGGYAFSRARPNSRDMEMGETRWGALTVKGQPLSGRAVDVRRDTIFIFLRCGAQDGTGADYNWSVSDIGGNLIERHGYVWVDDTMREGLNWRYNVMIQGADAVKYGSVAEFRDNLPDIDFLVALRGLAAARGEVLNIIDGRLVFDNLSDWSEWRRVDISKRVVKWDKIVRRVDGYAQHNHIRYDNGGGVDYIINNMMIDEQRDWLVLPWDGADASGYVSQHIERDGSGFADFTVIGDGEHDVLMYVGDSDYMQAVPITDNTFLRRVLMAGTSVSVQVNMDLSEWERIDGRTLLWWDGVLYTWITSNYDDGTATFDLLKI